MLNISEGFDARLPVKFSQTTPITVSENVTSGG